MFRFTRTNRRTDRRARLGLEALEHRELLASSLTGTLVKAPVAAKVVVAPTVLKDAATAQATKPPAQNALPPANQIALDRVSKPVASLAQSVVAKLPTAGQQSPDDQGPIEAANRGKEGTDLKALAQTQVASVQKGVQEALDSLGFGIGPAGGSTGGSGSITSLAGLGSMVSTSSGGSGLGGHPVRLGPGKDAAEQSPLLLTGNAAIDAAIAEMFRSPPDAAKDGLARGYNIGDPGQWTGELSFLQGEKIQLGGKEQDPRATSYDGKVDHKIYEGDGVLILMMNSGAREVVPADGSRGKGVSGSSDKTEVFIDAPGGTVVVTLPKNPNSPITIRPVKSDGTYGPLVRQINPKTGEATPPPKDTSKPDASKQPPKPASAPPPKDAPPPPKKDSTTKLPAPDKDDLSGATAGPLVAPANPLVVPGAEEGRRGTVDTDKLVSRTVAMAVSKVNPPPSKPDQGGGINQGSGLGGDNAGGVTSPLRTPTTFKGPKPSVGPVVGPGGPGRGPA